MAGEAEQLRAYVEYLRDMGVHDFYRRGEPVYAEVVPVAAPAAFDTSEAVSGIGEVVQARPLFAKTTVVDQPAVPVAVPVRPQFLEPPIAKLVSFDDLVPLPAARVDAAHKAEALVEIKTEIGDCTRCPLAYAGRRTIVFGDGDANARLMFVGEGAGGG